MNNPFKLSFHSSSRTLTNTILAGRGRETRMDEIYVWMNRWMRVDRPTLPIAWQGLESACRHSRAPSLERRFIFLVLPMRRGHLIRLLRGLCGDGEFFFAIFSSEMIRNGWVSGTAGMGFRSGNYLYNSCVQCSVDWIFRLFIVHCGEDRIAEFRWKSSSGEWGSE